LLVILSTSGSRRDLDFGSVEEQALHQSLGSSVCLLQRFALQHAQGPGSVFESGVKYLRQAVHAPIGHHAALYWS